MPPAPGKQSLRDHSTMLVPQLLKTCRICLYELARCRRQGLSLAVDLCPRPMTEETTRDLQRFELAFQNQDVVWKDLALMILLRRADVEQVAWDCLSALQCTAVAVGYSGNWRQYHQYHQALNLIKDFGFEFTCELAI